jgi:hypothetical protein
MYHFTHHCSVRIKEREISEEAVLQIIYKKVDVLIMPSDQDKDVDLYFGKIGEKYWLVVCDRYSNNIITVRRMRKQEKSLYERKLYGQN